MSIYKGYGGYGSPAQNERRYEELCEAYADAKERVEELESEVDELKDEIEKLKERNQYIEESYKYELKRISRLELDIEDFKAFGGDLIVDLMVSFYDSDKMKEFMELFSEDELNNMRIEANYQKYLNEEDE